MAAAASNQRIIPLEEGWNDEIKAKVSNGSVAGHHAWNFRSWELELLRTTSYTGKYVFFCVDFATHLIRSCVLDQAIDKLEDLLNGGMNSGQSSMFGPREYVAIYT